MSTPLRMAVLAAVGVALFALAVPRGMAHEAACRDGAAGLGCESRDTQKDACECDGTVVKGCVRRTAGRWRRIRARLRKLVRAQKKAQQAKIPPKLAKVDEDLGRTKTMIDALIEGNRGTDECKQAAAQLLDAFGVRVRDIFDPGSAASTTTTTTLPGGGALQGSGSIDLFDATEIVYDVSFTQPVEAFGVYVPGRSITADLPPGLASCARQSWTTEGDATPDNYYACQGTLGAGVHVTGNLRLVPGPASGMQIFLYGFQNNVRYGPFDVSTNF